MSNAQAAIKVADQVISRALNQRQFTVGEINYLIKELGEKADLEKNFDRILKIDQHVCVISDTFTNDLCKTSDKMVRDIIDQVTLLHGETERLLDIEMKYRQKEEDLLRVVRAEREKLKQDCYKSATSKLEKHKESLVEQELDMERKYLTFEDNLRSKKV